MEQTHRARWIAAETLSNRDDFFLPFGSDQLVERGLKTTPRQKDDQKPGQRLRHCAHITLPVDDPLP
jgi:hypothetical protein